VGSHRGAEVCGTTHKTVKRIVERHNAGGAAPPRRERGHNYDPVAELVRVDQNASVLLVAHSNAGLFVPLLVAHAPRAVRGCLFVDAALPALGDSTPVAPAQLLDFLRNKVVGDRLPPWTQWWDEADIAPMFPNPQLRAAVTAEEPRLPLAYYEQTVPVPVGWDDVPCGYLLFGPPYDEVAADARGRGWLVEELPGEHLHQIVDPDATADRLIAMAHGLGATERPSHS
jgi:hypothetical protein